MALSKRRVREINTKQQGQGCFVMPMQEQWRWLAELLDHSLAKQHSNQVIGEKEIFKDTALDDALTVLGLPTEQILEGLAFVCQLSSTELEFPTVHSLRKCHLGRLSRALAGLGEHRDGTLVEVCRRWLSFPEMIYMIDPNRLCRWLLHSSSIAKTLKDRLLQHDLSVLGPQRMQILAKLEGNHPTYSKIRSTIQQSLRNCLPHGSSTLYL